MRISFGRLVRVVGGSGVGFFLDIILTLLLRVILSILGSIGGGGLGMSRREGLKTREGSFDRSILVK